MFNPCCTKEQIVVREQVIEPVCNLSARKDPVCNLSAKKDLIRNLSARKDPVHKPFCLACISTSELNYFCSLDLERKVLLLCIHTETYT